MRPSSIRPGFWRNLKTRPIQAPAAKLSPPRAVVEAAEAEAEAEAAMMPIPAIITLTPQSTAVPSMRSQRFPPSEVVNCRVGQRSNPFSPAHRSSSARRSSAPPTCLETSAV